MNSVKEQVTGVHVTALAASGSEPRQFEKWQREAEDLRTALHWLGVQPQIERVRLGVAAVCLGSGYAATLADDEHFVRSVWLVVGSCRSAEAMRAADPEGFVAKFGVVTVLRRSLER